MSIACPNCGRSLEGEVRASDAGAPCCPDCGCTVRVFEQNTIVQTAPATKPPSASSGIELGIEGLQVVELLGRGGMGMVLEAVQTSLGRKVAVKVLDPQLAGSPDLVARFEREVAAMVRLATHPNIVTIFDQGRSAQGQVYYVMEYVEGPGGGAPVDLSKLIAQGRPDLDTTRRLILQIVDALGFAHEQGIVHRDVKPANVMIDRHRNAKMTDFGIAAVRGGAQTRQITMEASAMGTYDYMAPEQRVDAATVDSRADVYSTGVMLYEMLVGGLPYMHGNRPPSELVSGLDPAWDKVVHQAREFNLDQRVASMSQLRRMIEQIGGSTATGTTRVTAVPLSQTACPQCGQANSADAQFCLRCGGVLWMVCRKCQTRAEGAPRVCPTCGTDVRAMRELEECLALAKRGLEGTQTGRSLRERMNQAEEAGLALARALTVIPDDEEALAMRKEMNRRTMALLADAIKTADTAVREKRFGDATALCESILILAPDHVQVRQRMERLRSVRAESLAKARDFFQQGNFPQAQGLIDTTARHFPEDAEIASLAARYREQSASITKSLQTLPSLVAERRWLEIQRRVKDLMETGVRIRGLEEYASTAAQLFRQVEPQLAEARVCLAERRPDRALAEANGILSLIADHSEAQAICEEASRQPRRRRSLLKLAVGSIFLLFLIGGGGAAAYLYLTGRFGVDPPLPEWLLQPKPAVEADASPDWLVNAESNVEALESKLAKSVVESEFSSVGSLLASFESKLTRIESDVRGLKVKLEVAEQQVLQAAQPPLELDSNRLCTLLTAFELASDPVRSKDAARMLEAVSRDLEESKSQEWIRNAAAALAACGADLEKIAWSTDENASPKIASRVRAAEKRRDNLKSKLNDLDRRVGHLDSRINGLSTKIKTLECDLEGLNAESGPYGSELRLLLDMIEGSWNEDAVRRIIAALSGASVTRETEAAVRSLVAVVVLNRVEKVDSQRSARSVIQLVLAAEPSIPADPELRAMASAILERAVVGLVAGGELRLMSPNGRLAEAADSKVNEAIHLAGRWRASALPDSAELAYAALAAKGAGGLTNEEVREYASTYAEYRGAEIACWMGIRGLAAAQRGVSGAADAAKAAFQQALASDPGGELAPVAQAGSAALACRSVNPTDFYARARAERDLIGARRDWSQSFLRMLPETTWDESEHYTWVEQMQIVRTSQELDEALGRKESLRILWVHLTQAEVGRERLTILREWVSQGGSLWAGTDLVRSDTPGAEFGFDMKSNDVSTVSWSSQIDTRNMRPLMRPVLISADDGKAVDYTLHLSEGQFVALVRAIDKPAFEVFVFWPDPPVWKVGCARKGYGNGSLVFRPLHMEPASAARLFEIRLLNISLKANLPQPRELDVRMN